ncbi:hypothetical protein H5410_014498 [Solanum commersonii]|uniref:Uncharacterized protein n=1 Tax=Solanum commersonii TaxID=4109 RepID=A0A9J5ZRJ6_SOLCO|nr:hypothetical protein H5410_014498 [Solanum commersonii]
MHDFSHERRFQKIGSSKQSIEQRGKIEGSVVQDHIERETGDFYSYYFGDEVSCRRNTPNRNDEGDVDHLFPPISIFNQNGRGSKKPGKRSFTSMEMESSVTHILLNFSKIQPYLKSSGGEGDRFREHLGVNQPNKAKKKKSRIHVDFEDILGFLYSMPECINHDTYLLAVPFGTTDLQAYYHNYRRPTGTSPLTQHYVHPSVSPIPTATPDETFALAPRKRDRIGRVVIESNGSSWNPAKDAARALKDIGTRISSRQCSNKSKRLEAILRVARCTPEVQRALNRLQREMSDLEGIGSSCQAETLDGIQIASMLDR